MLMKCSHCGTQISKKWLFLGLPWSKYTCSKCGAVIGGTILRFIQNTIIIGICGYFSIQVLKGFITPFLLIPIIVLILVFFLVNLPGQIKGGGKPKGSEGK